MSWRTGRMHRVHSPPSMRCWASATGTTPPRSTSIIGSVDVESLGIQRGRAFAIAHSGNVDWVDPLIGLRLRHQFTPSQQVMLRGDVGGFGLASQFAWQAVGVYSYAWQFDGYALAGVLGYRALGVTYSEGYGINAAGANLVLHGPIVGFSIRF